VADHGGGRALYRVYDQLPVKDKQCVPGFNFTSNQLFWLGYSFYFCTAREGHENIKDYIDLLTDLPDEAGHYPSPWRVNTVLSNLPEFAKDFGCPPRSPLNPLPEERCDVPFGP